MATATLPAAPKPATRPGPPKFVKIEIGDLPVERRQLIFLKARCDETGLGFAEFLRALIDKELSECVAIRWKPSPPVPPIRPKDDPRLDLTEIDAHRRRLSGEEQDKIVVSTLSGTKISAVATCWGLGGSTIRRILKRRMPSPETIQQILFLVSKQYDGDQFINTSAIAQRCGVSEAVVSAIVANHRPLVPSAGVYARDPKPGGPARWMYGDRHIER